MHACSQRLSLNFKLEMIWVSNGFCNSSVGLLQSSDPSLPLWWFVQVRAWVRSPLYVHFSEVLGGLVHIRAYGLQQRRLNTVVIVGSWRWVWEGLRWFENQSSTLHSRAFALCDVIALVHNGHKYEVFGKVGQSSTSLGARIRSVISSMLVGQG